MKLKTVSKTTCCVKECAFLLPKSTQLSTTQRHQGKTGGVSPGCLSVVNVGLNFPPPPPFKSTMPQKQKYRVTATGDLIVFSYPSSGELCGGDEEGRRPSPSPLRHQFSHRACDPGAAGGDTRRLCLPSCARQHPGAV